MKRTITSILVGLTLATVVWLMTPTARAEIIVFTAQLLASNEVAPVAVNPSEAGASGGATGTLDTTANTARFDFTLTGMSSSTTIILAHIHEGGSGVNGPVRVDSGISPGAPVPAPGGAASFTRSNLTVPPAITTALVANPAGFYFNVHTALSTGGVARGQLVRQQTSPSVGAPTLSEWGAILMTLLIVAACTFFMLGRSKVAVALATAEAPATLAGPVKSVDWKLLVRVMLYVEAAIAIALMLLSASVVDVIGALTSGLVVAFILHLFIMNARRR